MRPNANDFIKDLERQLQSKRKTFYVDVHADLKPANREIQKWQKDTLKNIRAKISVGANMAQANTDVAQWRARQRTVRTNIPIGADLTKAYSELLAFRKVAGKPLEVDVRVNTQSAKVAAQRFAAAIGKQGISVPLTVDPNNIQRTASNINSSLITRLQNQGGVLIGVNANTAPAQAQIATFAAQSPTVTAQLDLDTKKAYLEYLTLRNDLLRRKLDVEVNVKTNGIDRAQKQFDQLEKRLGNFNFIRSLDLGPINLGKPGGLVGTLTTITALASAAPAAATAVTALSRALMDIGAAAALVPGAIGGIMAAMSTFSVGVSGMSDAFDAMKTMWTETPAQAASAARRSVQAHNQLRSAVRDEAQAQRDVGSARREATNDLRNLNNELRGSVLNEAQAILDLQKARDRLAQGGFESSTDFKQAQLDEAKAIENVRVVRERNGQLQQKVNEENLKGVEGSDKVTSALERQTTASEQAAMALEAIASTQATSALGKFQQEIDQLTPNARNFILVLAGMKGELEGLRNSVQERMFANAAPAFQQMLQQLLPVVGPGMERIADGINKTMLRGFDVLGGPEGQSIIGRLLEGTASAMDKMPGLIDPLIRGFGTLMAAGAEHLPQVVDLFTRLADRFANFIDNADKTGALDVFLDRGVDTLGKLAELGINLIQIVSNLGGAFKGDLLQSLVDVTQKFEDWIVSAEGQQKINGWIEEAKRLWEEWKPILADLPGIMGQVADAARNVLTPLLNILDKVSSFLANNPGLVEAFITGWLGVKVLVGVASPLVQLAKLLAGIVTAAKAIPNLIKGIPPMPPGGVPGTTPKPGGPGAPGAGWGAAAFAAAPIAIAAAGVPLINKGDDVARQQPGQGEIDQINAGLPAGIKPIAGYGRDLATQQAIRSMADQGHPLAKWVLEAAGPQAPAAPGTLGSDFIYPDPAAEVEVAKRYRWAMQNGNASTPPPPGSYMQGGFTPWGVEQGKMIEVHGKEFIQPHQTVDHYGVDAMEAIRQRRVPREVLGSFYPGGPVPWVPPVLDPNAHGASGGATPGPIPTGTDPSLAPMPTSQYGPMTSPTTGSQSGSSMNIFGLEIPLGQQDATRGWGPGGPPAGLGGGDGFDIRRFGIGPGPVGSGPSDWMSFAGNTFGNFLSGTMSALGQGILGGLGLGGITSSPYFTGATGLLSHFLNPNQTGVQAPGAGATNAAVDQSLNTYYGMPVNPSDPNAVLPPGTYNPYITQPGGVAAFVPGEAHGVAAGSEISYGAEGFQPWVYQIAEQFGVEASTYSGHQEGRGVNQGIDWRPKGFAVNSPEGAAVMDRFAQALQTAPGVEQIIWENPITGQRQGRDPGDRGANQTIDDYYAGNWAGHRDHVHTRHASGLYVINTATGPAVVGPAQAAAAPGGAVPATTASTGIPGLDELNAAMGGGSDTPPQGNGPLNLGQRAGQNPFMGSNIGAQAGTSFAGGAPPSLPLAVLQATGAGNYSQNPLGGPAGVTGPSQGKNDPKNVEKLKAIAKQIYSANGMPMAEWPAFERLIQKESSWDPTAKNPTSTAFGLGQFLDTTQKQYGIVGNANPVSQLLATFQYIKDRYDGSPAKALNFHNANNWYDRGGWLMPGQSTVDNATGKPELVVPWDKIPSFYGGGMDMPYPGPGMLGESVGFGQSSPGNFNPGIQIDTSNTHVGGRSTFPALHGALGQISQQGTYVPGDATPGGGGMAGPFSRPDLGAKIGSFYPGGFNGIKTGAVIPKPKPPRPPQIIQMKPRPAPPIAQAPPPPPVAAAPAPAPVAPMPVAPPPAPSAPTPQAPGVGGAPVPGTTVTPAQIGTGPGVGGGDGYLHPAASKGIQAGAAAIGSVADAAVAAGTFGAGAAAAGGLGGGLSASGVIKQAGKIVEGIANVGAAFLVGNVTNGTTENPYGVTQRGSNPTGGTRIVDNSTKYGDVYTQNQDEWFRKLDIREAQKSQANLGGYDRYA